MGSSIALHLAAAAPKLKIAVFERDATYSRASAPLSAGGIRQQFSLRENVELSVYGINFLKTGLSEMCKGLDIDTDVQFKENGYLFLASPGKGEQILRENNRTQHEAGCDYIKLMSPDDLKERFPWLNVENIALGSFGTRNEGYFDPWALLQAMKKGAIARGVEYVTMEVGSIKMGAAGRIDSIGLSDGTSVSANVVINAGGPQGGRIVRMCGPDVTPLPVEPRRRSMWQIHVASEEHIVPPTNTPLTVDTSGAYLRSEGSKFGGFVCGRSPDADKDLESDASDPNHWDELDSVDDELFMETIWPALAERVPSFESLKVESSWSGFYEYNSMDANGVVDWHPDVPNLLVACGFSGHGLQQSPAVGRSCTELITHGEFTSIDISCFGYRRIVQKEPLFEVGIV